MSTLQPSEIKANPRFQALIETKSSKDDRQVKTSDSFINLNAVIKQFLSQFYQLRETVIKQ